MFCLLLELNNFKQLVRLNPGLPREVGEGLSSTLEARGGKRIAGGEGGLFFHAFKASEAGEAFQVLDAALALRAFLLERREDLLGFILFLDHCRDFESPEGIFREMKEKLLHIEQSDGLVLGPAAADLLAGACDVEQAGRFFRVLEKTQAFDRGLGAAEDFCVRTGVIAELSGILSRRLDCLEGPDILLVHGSWDSGLVYQLDRSLRSLLDKKAVFSLAPAGTNDVFPTIFMNSLSAASLEAVPDYLSLTEKRIWQEKKELFPYYSLEPRHTRAPDYPKKDIFSLVSLFLTAFCRRCEASLMPAVVVAENLHAYSRDTRSVIAGLFRDFLPRWRLNLLATSRTPFLGYEFRNLPVSRFALPPLGPDEPPKERGCFQGGGILSLFHALQAPEAGPGTPLEALVGSLDRDFRDILYVLAETESLLSAAQLGDFLEILEIPREKNRYAFQRFKDLGFLKGEDRPSLAFPRLAGIVSRDSAIRKVLIDEELPLFLFRLWKKDLFPEEELLYRFFSERKRHRFALELLRSLAADRLDAADLSGARRLLYGPATAGASADPILGEWREALILAGKLRLAMAEADMKTADALFARSSELEFAFPAENPAWGEFLLQRARYLLSVKDIKKALAESKKAAILLQDREGSAGAVRANLELGLVMLAQENLENALDYFRLAQAAASNEGLRFERVRSGYFEAVIKFLQSDFSRVLGDCDLLLREADVTFSRRWKVLLGFLKGRALFELGEYEAAEELFQSLLADCEAAYPAPKAVLYSWMGRCLVYGGRFEEGQAVLSNLRSTQEVLYFRAEGKAFAGDPAAAKDLLADLLSRSPEAGCFLGEGLVWTDGYTFAENLLVGRLRGDSVLLRQAKAFLWLEAAACGETGRPAEEMYRFIRNEGASEHDPYNRLYYYWYGLILPKERDPAFEDRVTILGKAVKYLKQSTSRIDEAAHKASFTTKNRWNRRLLEEARNCNLS